MLKIRLDFNSDAGTKDGVFSKNLTKKGFEFVPSRRDGIIAFNLSLVLLQSEVNLILEKQGYKKYALGA